MRNQSNNKRIAKNSILLTIRLVITMCITLYTSRVVLNALGVSDYGIYNVVGGFVTIFTSLTGSFGRAMSRYMTVAIANNDIKEQRQVFSANFNILLVLSAVILLFCETVGSWYFTSVINVPVNRYAILNSVFQFYLFSFVSELFKTTGIAVIIAQEKSNIYALFGIVDSILKLAIACLLFCSPFDKLVFYSSLYALVSFLSFLYTFLYCKIKFEGFSYTNDVPKELYKSIFGFASWSLVGMSARVLNTQGLTLIVNKYCGVIVNAALGIVAQVDASMRQFVNNIGIAVNPQIVKSYATGNIEYMRTLITFATTCFSFIVLFYAVPISIEADYILKLWLGQVPEYTVPLLRLTFISTLFIVMAIPLEVAAQASGNIRRFQTSTSIVLLVTLPVVWLLLKMGVDVLYVYAILVLVYLFIVMIQFISTKEITRYKSLEYFANVILRVVLTALLSYVIPICVISQLSSSFVRICFSVVLTILITLICILTIGFNKNESKMLLGLIKSFIKRK